MFKLVLVALLLSGCSDAQFKAGEVVNTPPGCVDLRAADANADC